MKEIFKRPLRILTGAVLGLAFIVFGLGLLAARMAVFPPWYKVSDLSPKALPACTSYQERVYRYCGDPKASFGADFEAIETQLQGVSANFWWIQGPRDRAVVLVHGGGADRRAMLKHAEYLFKAGFSAAVVDCQNHGMAPNDGRGIGLGGRETQCVRAVAAWIKGRDAKLHVFAMGTSQGAFAVLRAGALDPRIERVLAENSYVSVERVLLEIHVLEWLPTIIKKMAIQFLDFWLPVPVAELDVHRFAQGLVLKPVLLIHGTQDETVSVEHSKEILKLITETPDHNLWIVTKGQHELLWNLNPADYEAKTLEFFGRD